MSVRKREWTTKDGETKQAWVVDYVDQQGKRHIETFAHRKEADARQAVIKVNISKGIHTPHNQSVTVEQAAKDWLATVELDGRERSTLAQYGQHVNRHIIPRIGRERLAKLTTPRINAFRDTLLRHLSRPLARKVLTSLKSLLWDAQRRGNVAQNVAESVSIEVKKRDNRRLEIGTDIPTVDEVKRILDVAQGRWRPLLATLVFTGLRASELRGLRWRDIDLKRGELHVRQRADRYNAIGRPKSKSGERTIPLGPMVLNTLREWRLACPKGEADLVFPTSTGAIEHHANLARGIQSAIVAAGATRDGEAKYGLHAFRHFFVSWCINRRQDGGLELPAKVVQERLGHASIVMTMDVYGHMFPRSDDGTELAAAERALLG